MSENVWMNFVAVFHLTYFLYEPFLPNWGTIEEKYIYINDPKQYDKIVPSAETAVAALRQQHALCV